MLARDSDIKRAEEVSPTSPSYHEDLVSEIKRVENLRKAVSPKATSLLEVDSLILARAVIEICGAVDRIESAVEQIPNNDPYY